MPIIIMIIIAIEVTIIIFLLGYNVHTNRNLEQAKKSKKRNLDNILFVRKRAETILDFLGKDEIAGVYINFPDPWEGEEKKRVISKSLFFKLDIVLKTNGKLFFKTDHDQYYENVLELINELDNYKIIYHTNDLHNSEKASENIKTEFEQMFLSKHNMKIKYIEIQKNR